MTISIWRFCHLTLAIGASVFILIASITGTILAVEPIQDGLNERSLQQNNNISLAETLQHLDTEYDEVLHLEVTDYHRVIATVITKDGKDARFYVDPSTGKKIGALPARAPIYTFATNLHRSLFLKSTGRILITVASLLLLLLACSGLILIKKRQGGWRRLFSKVVNENFSQYSHVVLGRYLLIPIIIITLSGIYISLEKFAVIPKSQTQLEYPDEAISFNERLAVHEFPLFQDLSITDVEDIQFPFSDDAEDYFEIKHKQGVYLVHQYSGEIVSSDEKSILSKVSSLSFFLHTGFGSVLWSVVLFIGSLGILYFLYSGFRIYFNRNKSKVKDINSYAYDQAEIVVLVGSETGSTYAIATKFCEALLKHGQKVYLTEMNNFIPSEKLEKLIIFTATYGEGESPTNARNFLRIIEETTFEHEIAYAVLGFGSVLYPHYCQFAIDVDKALAAHHSFKELLPLQKINNQSNEAFQHWLRAFNTVFDSHLKVVLKKPVAKRGQHKLFKVVAKTDNQVDDTFLLHLQPAKRTKFSSGDLLRIVPEEDAVERLYSIGKVSHQIILSIKKHQEGVCSTYLSNLEINDMIAAAIKTNPDFHYHHSTSEVLLIANGTGIAPFLGMIDENIKQIKTHLFWGGRTKASFGLYEDLVHKALEDQKLSSLHIAYSQEGKRAYVQDILKEHAKLVAHVLENDGTIMICGSIAMQHEVLELLQHIAQTAFNLPLSAFENREQIKMDCY